MLSNEPFVDDDDEPNPEYNELTNLIIGACIEVHRSVGPGYPESFYQRALSIELTHRGIPFVEQCPIDVRYKGIVIGEGRLDFLVFGKVVLELKSVESLNSVHVAQMVAYLNATGCKLGLIINFNVRMLKDGIRRIAN